MKQAIGVALFFFGYMAFSMDCEHASGHQNAFQKKEAAWGAISESAFGDNLPPITGPGFLGVRELMCSKFDSKAFTNDGDEMEQDRIKHIHKFGTVTSVAFKKTKKQHPFTGLFSSGADHGLLRLSLAEPSDGAIFKPGFGLKLFVDGHPSVNIFAMPSLDGQDNHNLFALDFTTSLPQPAFSVEGFALACAFKKALKKIGHKDGNILSLSYLHMAGVTQVGAIVAEHRAPHSMIFRPTDAAKALFAKSNRDDDFRKVLEDQGNGITLFEVFGLEQNSTDLIKLGSIKTTSSFKASQYGDRLFFKHPEPHTI